MKRSYSEKQGAIPISSCSPLMLINRIFVTILCINDLITLVNSVIEYPRDIRSYFDSIFLLNIFFNSHIKLINYRI